MIVFSHIEVGNYYYHAVAKNKDDSFKLRWCAFIFGNIFPDISKFASGNHYYDDTRSVYRCFLKKATDPSGSDWKRSMASGVVCHFLCDYFCKYHAKMPYTQRPMLLHLVYEFILHVRIKNILLKKSLGLLSAAEQYVFRQTEDNSGADFKESDHNGTKSRFNLPGMILEYEAKDESLLMDVSFAFEAVSRAMKEILASEKTVSNEKDREERMLLYRATA